MVATEEKSVTQEWVRFMDTAKILNVAPITLRGIVKRHGIATKDDIRDRRVKYVDMTAIRKLLKG